MFQDKLLLSKHVDSIQIVGAEVSIACLQAN